jgi:hypothetical protein
MLDGFSHTFGVIKPYCICVVPHNNTTGNKASNDKFTFEVSCK